MKILIVADTLLTGGAEWFLLRQYKYLLDSGHTPHLFVTRPDLVDKRMLENFSSVLFISAPTTLVRMAAFADRVIQKLLKKDFILNALNKFYIRSFLVNQRPDVIHSHLFQADYQVFLANRKNPVRHIITVHGDYLELIRKNKTNYFSRIRQVLNAVDSIVFISAAHQEGLINFSPSLNNKLVKIYNGYPLKKLPPAPIHDGFYFGMIARGIQEKGWEEAIKAFLKWNNPVSQLLFYGEGIYLDQLARKYTDPRIVFKGFTNDPLIAIQQIDVGLFTSYIQSEGLPTTIIEYLLLHKPVITTNVGESAEMIRHGEALAGIVLDLKNGKPDVDELATAMQKLSTDKAFYRQCSDVAKQAKNKFGMEECMSQYLEVYKK